MSNAEGPFTRDESVDKPGIVGARWWNQGLIDEERAMSRRKAVGLIAVGAVGVAVVGAVGVGINAAVTSAYKAGERVALAMQKEFGWDFGARTVALVFNGSTTERFDPKRLATLEADLAPKRHLPWHVPTLLQSLTAPSKRLPRDTSSQRLLPAQLMPIQTAAMTNAYMLGGLIGKLFAGRGAEALLIVDLDGEDSIAFAAGAANFLEPIFGMDNWPHPVGVVSSHLTLASAAYYQPVFAEAKVKRPESAGGLIVLDRRRLSAYTDDAKHFDNRYLAKIPSASALKAAGYKRVLYITNQSTGAAAYELDDLNAAFVALQSEGVEVRAVSLDVFSVSSGQANYGIGGTIESFWRDYPWVSTTAPKAIVNSAYTAYTPRARPTAFSSGKPANFGKVHVVTKDGAVAGAELDATGPWRSDTNYQGSSNYMVIVAPRRSGSFTRSSGGWGG